MKLSRIFLLLALPYSAVAMILMTVAYLVAYRPDVSNYFTNGSPLPIQATVFACLAVVFGVVGAILSKRLGTPFAKPSAPSFAVLPAALGSLVTAVLLFIAKEPLPAVLFLLTAVYFALSASSLAKRYASAILWVGFASVAATVVLNAAYYFDMAVEMNAPVKILLQMGLLAAMLYCCIEMRISAGLTNGSFTPILTVLAVALCGLSSVPIAVLQFVGELPALAYFAASPVLFGICVTASLRLCQLIAATEPKTATAEEATEKERASE